jgi:hypothetical protein
MAISPEERAKDREACIEALVRALDHINEMESKGEFPSRAVVLLLHDEEKDGSRWSRYTYNASHFMTIHELWGYVGWHLRKIEQAAAARFLPDDE